MSLTTALLCLDAGEITDSLGKVCSLEVPVLPGLLPPPTATATVLEVRNLFLPASCALRRLIYGNPD